MLWVNIYQKNKKNMNLKRTRESFESLVVKVIFVLHKPNQKKQFQENTF